jgi:predicted O-linked N-acetylglucosamine transferase (SPINDLY family)
MDDWVATSTADYVRRAVDKRRQADAAAHLRTTLRQRFAGSPVCDAPRFARDLETAFRSMWQRHCSDTGTA